MSKYTTGEIAKLCGVSVRTVQYYDDRGILVPSELSEGGRRLYTDSDLKRMHIICFLREAGLSINSISALFAEKKPENIISILIEQHQQSLQKDLTDVQKKLDIINGIKRELKSIDTFSVESIGDIAHIMKQKDKLKKLHLTMLLLSIPIDILQIISIVLWITSGLWWLFIIWSCVAILFGIFISKYYFDHIAYICPECHKIFKPKLKEAFFAYHTPRMRHLTCPECSFKGLCIEIYDEKKDVKRNG